MSDSRLHIAVVSNTRVFLDTGSVNLLICQTGGSLAGLIHGVALKSLGHDIEIFECSSTSTPDA